MARFIDLEDGSMVNIDYIERRSRSKKRSDGKYYYELYGKDGLLGSTDSPPNVFWNKTIVPANAGFKLIGFGMDEEDEELWSEEHEIIAWKITDEEYITPMTADSGAPDELGYEVWLVKEPSGLLVKPGDCTFDDMEGARKEVTKRILHARSMRPAKKESSS